MDTAIKQQKKRSRVLAGFYIRMVCFFLIAVLVLGYALYVLTPKNDYGICSMVNYYFQPRDTVDVLVLGTSTAYSGVNTNVLWRKYGIAAYDLCGAEMPYWAIYYYLREALKTQHPKVILLDAKPSIYALPYSRKSRVILSTYGIKSPVNRFGSIIASTHPSNTLSFLVGYPHIHNNYANITAEDFFIPANNGNRGANWKGYIEMDATDTFFAPVLEWNDTQKPLQDKQKYYLEMIYQTAMEHGIQLVLVGFPNPDYAYDHPYYNTTSALAAEYGFSYWNFNQPEELTGLDYERHFADWQHLNIEGSLLFTKQLGAKIKEEFQMPDRRGLSAWNSWEACANEWFAFYQHREKERDE